MEPIYDRIQTLPKSGYFYGESGGFLSFSFYRFKMAPCLEIGVELHHSYAVMEWCQERKITINI